MAGKCLALSLVGVVSALVLELQGRWTGGSGSLSRGDAAPITVGSPFRIASITKLFVATVVLQLVDTGSVHLDDPLADYLPTYSRSQSISIRHLLDHTSRVPDSGQVEGFGRSLIDHRDRHWNVTELLEIAAYQRPEFAPGTNYGYSTDYLLLREVIRVATGRSWSLPPSGLLWSMGHRAVLDHRPQVVPIDQLLQPT